MERDEDVTIGIAVGQSLKAVHNEGQTGSGNPELTELLAQAFWDPQHAGEILNRFFKWRPSR